MPFHIDHFVAIYEYIISQNSVRLQFSPGIFRVIRFAPCLTGMVTWNDPRCIERLVCVRALDDENCLVQGIWIVPCDWKSSNLSVNPRSEYEPDCVTDLASCDATTVHRSSHKRKGRVTCWHCKLNPVPKYENFRFLYSV